MQDKVRNDLLDLADEKYKKFHSNLCPGTQNIIGVRVPILRNYAKDIVKGDWREYLKTAKSEYYEEILLQGLVIGLAKVDIEETLSYLTGFIPKIDNWAICDSTVAGLKNFRKNKEKVWEFIQKYINSNKEFEIRFAIITLLDFYIEEEYLDRVLNILDEIEHEGYYVKMAIAWAISVAYIKYPKETLKYLKNNHLDDWVYNKALQKIIESNRIDKKEKEFIRSMKRGN